MVTVMGISLILELSLRFIGRCLRPGAHLILGAIDYPEIGALVETCGPALDGLTHVDAFKRDA